ncbi:hypothetical protein B0H11DRAFT_2384842 [Mycena galericulata]|nr:hypothetical protein B0H11DRAFT_2384842 [Mycena galericulata]
MSLNTPITFAPNVTPISYSAPSPEPSPFASLALTTDLPFPLFPPSLTPATPPTRRRVPTGKRRSQGYIPRPPNAFMLFRADFVRQKHVPVSIETNHGSLSKIIGNCWRALPLPEKDIWETKAKRAKAEHKLKYPDYKFRPVQNKRGAAASASTSTVPPPARLASRSTGGSTPKGQLTPQEDERRCEEVAALLLQGKKGEDLAWAVRDVASRRKAKLSQLSLSPVSLPYHVSSNPSSLDPMYYPQLHMPFLPPSSSLASSQPSSTGYDSPYSLPMPLDHNNDTWRHRRSSSVPLPNDYSYNLPPFMYQEGMGITLPALRFPSQLTLPYPPSSSDDSSVSGLGRMSPTFSSDIDMVSFAGPFSGGWGSRSGSNGHGPVGRRASSAQAFFSPSSFPQSAGQGELPDVDTSLFEAGFLNSFGGSASGSGTGSHVNDAVSPFDAPTSEQTVLHSPQPVHAASPLGVEFAEHQAQGYEQQGMFDAGESGFNVKLFLHQSNRSEMAAEALEAAGVSIDVNCGAQRGEKWNAVPPRSETEPPFDIPMG